MNNDPQQDVQKSSLPQRLQRQTWRYLRRIRLALHAKFKPVPRSATRRLQDMIIEAPFLQVVAGWIITYVAIALAFALIYSKVPAVIRANVGSTKDIQDLIHFSFTTQATVGYGDIYPVSASRYVAIVHEILGMGMNSLALGLITFKLLRRPSPIVFPSILSTYEAIVDKKKQGVYWIRFLNIDRYPLVNVELEVSFLRAQHKKSDKISYDTEFVKVVLEQMRTVLPDRIIAHRVWSRPKGSINPDRKSDLPWAPPPGFFVYRGSVDRSAFLQVTVSGTMSATGEFFSAVKNYFAVDIVCRPYIGVNNNLLVKRSRRFKLRYLMRAFNRFERVERDDCRRCQDFAACPFGQRVGVAVADGGGSPTS